MDRPAVGVAHIIFDGRKVLMGLRKGPHAEGMYAFPGGHLEMWESFEQAAARETWEETGLFVTPSQIKQWVTMNTLFPNEDKHYVCVFMVSEYDRETMGVPDNTEPNKLAGWEWIDWDQMPSNIMNGISQIKNKNLEPFGLI